MNRNGIGGLVALESSSPLLCGSVRKCDHMVSTTDKFLMARITQRTEVAQDLWTIRVDPGGPFSFTAGQYATLGVLNGSHLVERAYSILSSPSEPELEFYLELVHDGHLTPLLNRLKAGDTLSLRRAAKGRFIFDTTSGRTNHLLLCTVTGVAPFVSYMRTFAREWRQGRFTGGHRLFLIQGASRAREFGYREEMENLAGEVPWLTYVPTVSRPWEDLWPGETGRVDDVLRKYADLWSLDGRQTTAYLCGHPGLLANSKEILQRHGWPADALKAESYFVPARAHA
jgi:ferredoxin--NADP+ reductase